jgi:hypothetical protein
VANHLNDTFPITPCPVTAPSELFSIWTRERGKLLDERNVTMGL